MGARRWTALLCVAALVVVAHSTSAATSAPTVDGPDARRMAALDAVLDQREAALAAGDESAWMDTVDPQAPAGFIESQRQAFRGWRSVPIDALRLQVRPDDIGDVAPMLAGRLVAEHGQQTMALVEVERRYRLVGFDDRDMIDHEFATFVRRDGRWLLRDLDDLRFLGLDSATTTWELGPVRVRPTEHFLVISHPDLAGRADELADIAERAHQRFSEHWPRPWSGRLPLVLPRSVAELERVLQTTFDLSNFVAFVSYDVDRRDGAYVTTAPRIYIQDHNLSRHTETFQLDTLVHELVHAASSAASGPFSEAWVQEGVAEWFTNGASRSTRLPAGADGVPNDPYQFNTGTQRQIIGSYDESEALISVLAARTSTDDVFDFFDALGARRRAPGSSDHNIEAALRATTGLSLTDLAAAAR